MASNSDKVRQKARDARRAAVKKRLRDAHKKAVAAAEAAAVSRMLLSELPSWCKLACANAAGGADGRCTVLRTALSNLLQQLRWLDERVASVQLLHLYM